MANEKTVASYEEVVLGAWLHDVGKFAQRADREEYHARDREAQIQPKHKTGSYYTHTHVAYTDGFIQAMRDVFPEAVRYNVVADLACYHHNPSEYHHWLVAIADRFASGADRREKNSEVTRSEKELDAEHKKNFYEVAMTSILTMISDNGISKIGEKLALKSLSSEALFPVTKDTGKSEYAQLWNKFEVDFKKLQGLTLDKFMPALQSLLEHYWSFIPSTTIDEPDISLYHHSKLVAAFASTLYRYHETSYTETEKALKDQDSQKMRFSLVQGDISGIQNYIFDLPRAKNNAKILRARSFQLTILSKIIAEDICREFKLTTANILSSAAGKFLVLLPATADAQEKIVQLRTKFEKYFLDEFAGKLAFILSPGYELAGTASDIEQKKWQEIFAAMQDDLGKQKTKKFQGVINEEGAVLETLYNSIQKAGDRCPCCEIQACSTSSKDDEEDGKICEQCRGLIEIGRQLVTAKHIYIRSNELASIAELVSFNNSKNNSGLEYSINEFCAGKPRLFLPYTVPVKNEDVIDFEVIAAMVTDEYPEGNKKLALLKADVDNLGFIFSAALGDKTSLSRYMALSENLHFFFAAYLQHFINTDTRFQNKIYVVFSGGDDVCVLGAWNVIMEFASAFHFEFEKLSNKNPALTLSAGIALINPNIPVRTMAHLAEAQLELSKKIAIEKKDDRNKNSITVFDTSVSWEAYTKLLGHGKQLTQYLQKGKISTAMVYKLLHYADAAKRVKDGKIEALAWKSHASYAIARNILKVDKKKTAEEENECKAIANLYRALIGDTVVTEAVIAASYALYTQRNKGGV